MHNDRIFINFYIRMNWVEFPHNYLLLLEHQENNDHRSLSSIDAMTRNKKLQ